MLRNGLTENFVSILARTKTIKTKINGSCHNVFFGGVDLGGHVEKNYTFFSDNDAEVKVWIDNTNDTDAFQVCVVE